MRFAKTPPPVRLEISPIYRSRIARVPYFGPGPTSKCCSRNSTSLLPLIFVAMGSAVSISAADLAAGIGSTILAVQLLTPADPIGRTWQLIRQFRKQVRRYQRGEERGQ